VKPKALIERRFRISQVDKEVDYLVDLCPDKRSYTARYLRDYLDGNREMGDRARPG